MRFSAEVAKVMIFTFTLLGCLDSTFEPVWPEPGTTVATAVAPDKAAVAVLIAKKERGHYRFEIRDTGSGDTLEKTDVAVPIGYHEHVISIRWVDSRRAEATIDSDFGDNNILFTLSY